MRDISFSFEPGKSYAVVGASGSGKSTLLHLLSASQTGYSGQILYDGQELRDIDVYKRQGLPPARRSVYPGGGGRGAAEASPEGGKNMLKDITLGQYLPGKSLVHQLDPRCV